MSNAHRLALLVTVSVICTAGVLSSAPEDTRQSRAVGPACEERVAQLLQTLDPTDPIRIIMERGQRGQGIHYPWMDTMKGLGIKVAVIDVRFVWDSEVRSLEVGPITYFREYYSMSPPIGDASTMEMIHSEGLEQELKAFVLSEAQTVVPERLRKEGYRRAHGIFPFVLLDDECLPAMIPPAHVKNDDFSDLMRAADEGDLSKVEALLRAGAEVNQQDVHGMTALIYAAGGGHTEIAKILIAAGADLHIIDNGRETALTTAVRLGHLDMVRLLTERGAYPDRGVSLWHAAGGGDLEILKLLLKAGASPNVRALRGITPLIVAAGRGDAEIVKTLLEAGADPNFKDDFGRTALSLAEWEARQPRGHSHARRPPDYGEVIRLLKAAGAKG